MSIHYILEKWREGYETGKREKDRKQKIVSQGECQREKRVIIDVKKKTKKKRKKREER